MLKIISSVVILVFAFTVGTHGFNSPNEKAPFYEKMKFALELEQVMASGSTPADAASWAKGLWEFVAGDGSGNDDYIYGWIQKMLVNFSDTMVALGYPTCSDIPTSGSVSYPGAAGVSISFSNGDKAVPAGSIWSNSGVNYSKKVSADMSGTGFFEVQYDCNNNQPNIYLKYDFSSFESAQRKVEIYAQHDANTDKVSMEIRMNCTDPVECGTKTNLVLSMNTPDGDEYKIIGTRIVDDIIDEAKRMSVHGKKSLKLADIHMLDGTDLSNSDDINPANATVDGHCIDFNSATFVPSGGSADCTAESLNAEDELNTSMTNVYTLGNYHVSTVEAMTISF